jgi:cell division protein FtsL
MTSKLNVANLVLSESVNLYLLVLYALSSIGVAHGAHHGKPRDSLCPL